MSSAKPTVPRLTYQARIVAVKHLLFDPMPKSVVLVGLAPLPRTASPIEGELAIRAVDDPDDEPDCVAHGHRGGDGHVDGVLDRGRAISCLR